VDFPIHSPLRVCLASGLLERRRIEGCRREVDNLQKPSRPRRNMPNRGPLVQFPLCVNAVSRGAVRAPSGRGRAVFLGLYSLSTLKGGRSRPLYSEDLQPDLAARIPSGLAVSGRRCLCACVLHLLLCAHALGNLESMTGLAISDGPVTYYPSPALSAQQPRIDVIFGPRRQLAPHLSTIPQQQNLRGRGARDLTFHCHRNHR
jgi:hypothetical protein